jgi:predicted TIM-barrel fold metal-dependent hydrolase
MIDTTCAGPVPDPKVPALRLPPGSCDAHCHVFGPVDRFPYAVDRTFTPPEAPKERLRALHRILGLDRAVIVQSVCHGNDHTALFDALEAGGGSYRGVALVGPPTPEHEITRLHNAGVRGARLNFTPHLGPAPTPETVRAVADLVGPFGWHLAVHLAGEGVADHESLIASLAVPVVIDHMARVDLRAGLESEAIRALSRLLETGDVWIKLSGADRLATRPPDFDDAVALARLLVQRAPQRVLWGTDFPHPNTRGFMPDDGIMVDLIERFAPDEATRHRLLVSNPAACFGFPTGV